MLNEKRGEKYFVKSDNHTVGCLIGTKNVSVLKNYNRGRHYETKHFSKYLNTLSGKLLTEKFQLMKRIFAVSKKSDVKKSTKSETVTRTSFKIVQKIIEREKPFTDGNHVKKCMNSKSLVFKKSRFVCKY